MKNIDQIEKPNSLYIAAAGLCCSLGYHLKAAVCAIRANMDHFQESKYYGGSAIPINVAMLSDDVYGDERTQRWISYVVRDCASQLEDPGSLFNVGQTAIVILGSGSDRPHADSTRLAEITSAVMAKLRLDILPDALIAAGESRQYQMSVIMEARSGLSAGLLQAARYIANNQAEQVLLIGADSYLNAADINFFLEEKRILLQGNSDGFIPGEAAAAVVLRAALDEAPGVHIKGVGRGDEQGRQDGSVPSRSIGMTTAIRAACVQAKIEPENLGFRLSDQNGEQFYSNDAANAMTRIMFGGPQLAHLTLADKLGEVGAATGPAMLAWLYRDMADPHHSPGDTGLIHLADDNGARCAVVVRYYGDE